MTNTITHDAKIFKKHSTMHIQTHKPEIRSDQRTKCIMTSVLSPTPNVMTHDTFSISSHAKHTLNVITPETHTQSPHIRNTLSISSHPKQTLNLLTTETHSLSPRIRNTLSIYSHPKHTSTLQIIHQCKRRLTTSRKR